jgi:ketosteroid isomerase-like protein
LLLAAPGQVAVSTELQALADAERSFAKRATEIGWRDAFLEFFDDAAVALVPEPAPAKDRLRKQPSQPFSVAELTWEPRTGEIATSGELGWLTGPSTSINRAAPDPKPRYGNYLSVWRRQPGGGWRVIIDVGIGVPEPAAFAPGFTRFEFDRLYRGADSKEATRPPLLQADRDLNARIGSEGSAAAFRRALAPRARLHRGGHAPAVGSDAATLWLEQQTPKMRATTGAADCARSADLGYSYGRYEVQGEPVESGAYLRVWQREASGTWRIVADVSQPVRR